MVRLAVTEPPGATLTEGVLDAIVIDGGAVTEKIRVATLLPKPGMLLVKAAPMVCDPTASAFERDEGSVAIPEAFTAIAG